MSPSSRKLLSTLLGKNSRESLLTLWTDLSQLNRDDFLALLDQLQAPKKARPRTKKVPAVPADDRPVTRIAFELQHNKKLTASVAQRRVAEILVERGYPLESIPAPQRSLVSWIDALLRSVPSAEVMDAAKQVQ